MIFVVLACVFAWKRLQGELIERAVGIAIISVLVTGMTVITAGSVPVAVVRTGPNEVLRVMPPTAVPFTMQQYRNYDTNTFYYRIVIGWPNGIPIYEGMEIDDQSEYIIPAHLYVAVLLGAYMAAGTVMALAVVFLLGLRRRNQDQNETNDFNLNYLVKFFKIGAIFSISLAMFLFPDVFPFLPSRFIFEIGFWGLFVGLGVCIFFLFMPNSRRQQYTKNDSHE
ncbi:MAG: hypothetical protein ACXAEN_09030 [Candidatus Thorarchaeota archaeon]